MNKFIRNLRCNGVCELVYLRPFYNLDRDNIHYVCDYDEDKIGVNVFALYEENEELKKRLEEYKEQVNKGLYSTCFPYKTGYDKAVENYKNQQQEFIKHLEGEIEKTCNSKNMSKCNLYQEILQKHKEIIGNDINVGSKGENK